MDKYEDLIEQYVENLMKVFLLSWHQVRKRSIWKLLKIV